MERWHSCGAEYSFSPIEYMYDKECLSCRLLFVLCVCCYIWPLYKLFVWTCEQQSTKRICFHLFVCCMCIRMCLSLCIENTNWLEDLGCDLFVCLRFACVFVGEGCVVLLCLSRGVCLYWGVFASLITCRWGGLSLLQKRERTDLLGVCRGWCYILKPEEKAHLSLLQRRDVQIKSHREKVK